MSIRIMSAIFDKERNTSGSKRLVLLALADNANDEWVCWPSLATIARKANISRAYTKQLVHELETDGYIKIKRRPQPNDRNKSNMYQIIPLWVGDVELPLQPVGEAGFPQEGEEEFPQRGIPASPESSSESSFKPSLAAENQPPQENEPVIPETPVTYPEKEKGFTLTGIWSMAIADHGQIKNKAAARALEANMKRQVEGAVDLGWLNEYQRPLIDAFVTASGIKPVKGDYGLWRKAAGNWLLIKLTTSDIVGAVQKLRAGNLTISGPQSVTNTARAIHCNPTGEQQGTLDNLERNGYTYGGS